MRVFGLHSVMAICLAVIGTADAATGTIAITRLSGEVKVFESGVAVAARLDTRLSTPLKIETGADGSLRVEQASAVLDIGPNSIVLLPGESGAGKAEKVIQNLGRVLYSVEPRKSRPFAVQTPYLVSVVKGTVFSVAIEDSATAVSLLEGSVELLAEGIEPVLLHPNETARRGADDRTITVTKIDTAAPPVSPRASTTGDAPSTTIGSKSLAALAPTDARVFGELSEITAAYRQQRSSQSVVEAPEPDAHPTVPVPSVPGAGPQAPSAPQTRSPEPEAPTTPAPQVPTSEVPSIEPLPPGPSDDDDDRDDCRRKKCDSDEDHDNGRGNDDRIDDDDRD